MIVLFICLFCPWIVFVRMLVWFLATPVSAPPPPPAPANELIMQCGLSICTTFPPRDTPKWHSQVHPNKGTERRKVPHRHMGSYIHRWISNSSCVEWRNRSFYPLPRRTDSVAGCPDWKTLHQLWCKSAGASDSGLYHTDSKQRFPSVDVPDRCPLHAGSFVE